jgi:putative ABC transport system permease protein
MSWLSRLVNAIRSDAQDDEVDEELRFHVEEQTRRLMADGLSRADAARAARLRLGNAVNLRERSRDIRLLPWVDSLLRDVRFGVRMLRKDAVVTGAAVASLALAMGAAITAFILIDALILRPLPVPEPGRLIYLAADDSARRSDRGENPWFSYPFFIRLQKAASGRAALFAVSYQAPQSFSTGGADAGDGNVYAQYVSANTFAELALAPALGRLLVTSDDSAPGAHPVAVISHSFWTRRFGSDRAVLGRWITVAGARVQIVGVAPSGFTGVMPGMRTDVWLPMTMYHPEALASAAWQWLQVLGRLAPGIDAPSARALLQPAFTNFRRDRAGKFPATAPREMVRQFIEAPLIVSSASTGPSELRTGFERPLWILAVVVGLVMLIACSNVANLLTARAAARGREMALRLSIGAGRWRLAQQLLIESGLMASLACVLGVAFAYAAGPVIVGMLAPSAAPVYLELEFNRRVVAFLFVTLTATTILFGLTPALRASSFSPGDTLKASGVRTGRRLGLLRPLVVAQVAFSLTVVFVAALLVGSFVRLAHVDTGFVSEGVALVNIGSAELSDREEKSPGSTQAIADEILDQARQVNGVQSASMSGWALFAGSGWTSYVALPGQQSDFADVYFLEVSPAFMQTMGIRLLDGRELGRADMHRENPATPTSVIVNETFAKRYFPEGRVVGKSFNRLIDSGSLQPESIVGLVADAKYRELRQPPPPTAYVPLQHGIERMTLQVKSPFGPDALMARLRPVVARIHPSLKINEVVPQATLVSNTLLKERLLALLSGFFGLISLVLAAVGLYGVLSYSVVQRKREIGIRLALGAPTASVIRSMLTDVVLLIVGGVIAGLACGLGLARFVRTLLFEVTPYDPASLLVPLLVLASAAIAAAVPPALRASRVDPIEALRDE